MAKIALKKTYQYLDTDFTILVDGKPLQNKKHPELNSSVSFREFETTQKYYCEVYLFYGEKNVDSFTILTKKGDESNILKLLRPILKYTIGNILDQCSE